MNRVILARPADAALVTVELSDQLEIQAATVKMEHMEMMVHPETTDHRHSRKESRHQRSRSVDANLDQPEIRDQPVARDHPADPVNQDQPVTMVKEAPVSLEIKDRQEDLDMLDLRVPLVTTAELLQDPQDPLEVLVLQVQTELLVTPDLLEMLASPEVMAVQADLETKDRMEIMETEAEMATLDLVDPLDLQDPALSARFQELRQDTKFYEFWLLTLTRAIFITRKSSP